MKEAFGGIVNLVFIVVFLLVMMGLLGLVVSYSKAFKMKNIIISTIEEYDGYGCGTKSGITKEDSACLTKIKNEASNLGYNPVVNRCSSSDYNDAFGLYCYSVTNAKDSSGTFETKNEIYHIELNVDVNFPLVSDILGMSVFKINGDTRIISH